MLASDTIFIFKSKKINIGAGVSGCMKFQDAAKKKDNS